MPNDCNLLFSPLQNPRKNLVPSKLLRISSNEAGFLNPWPLIFSNLFHNHRKNQTIELFSCLTSRDLWERNITQKVLHAKVNRHQFPTHEPAEHSSALCSRDLQLHHKMCLQFFLLLRFQRFFFRFALEMIVMVGREEKPRKINSIEVSIVAQFHDEFLAFVCGLSIKRCEHKRKKEMREISSLTLWPLVAFSGVWHRSTYQLKDVKIIDSVWVTVHLVSEYFKKPNWTHQILICHF